MNWGKWIVVSFILFAVFIGTLTTICMRQEVSLVSKDYYKDELAFQDQINRVQNTNDLEQRPKLSINQQGLEIDYNEFSKIENGRLILFCPSNPKQDRKFIIEASSSGKRLVSTQNIKAGMYHAKFYWTIEGKEFYIEKTITL
jgi:hypothetical protein